MTEAVRLPLFRPLLHAATGLGALALGVLPREWALVCAGLGVLAGWVVFPLTGLEERLRRPGEPFLGGLRTYPLAVLGLILWLPPTEAAAAWGILAFGDAGAAIVGTLWRAPALLGHPKATWSGSAAHLVLGGLAACALSRAVAALADATDLVAAGPVPAVHTCFLAAAVATILDLVPLPPDDNIPAAAAAGGVLYASRVLS